MTVSFTPEWPAMDQVTPVLVNQYVIQGGVPTASHNGDGILYLSFGHVLPPFIYGTPEQMKRQVERMDGQLPITVVACVSLALDRAEELGKLLLAQVDVARREAAAPSTAKPVGQP